MFKLLIKSNRRIIIIGELFWWVGGGAGGAGVADFRKKNILQTNFERKKFPILKKICYDLQSWKIFYTVVCRGKKFYHLRFGEKYSFSLKPFSKVKWLVPNGYIHFFVSADKRNKPAKSTTQLCTQLPKLQDLLQFICGSLFLLSDRLLKISFTNSTLSDRESCFSTIKLPLHKNDCQAFETSMNIAVNCQHQGYGRG